MSMKRLLAILLITILLATPLLAQRLSATKTLEQETLCLANNVYFEARGESFKGKLAVAVVTLNRVNSGDFADSICGVVYQKDQFSWTRSKNKVRDEAAWAVSLLAANMAMEDPNILGFFPALHFHSVSINPRWGLRKIAKIDRHIFYV